jgi:hypothetical protein
MFEKKSNKIKIIGSIVMVDVSTEKYPDSTMLIELADWVMLQELGIGRVWAEKYDSGLRASCRLGDNMKRVHRLLLPESESVDHQDGSGLNNLRSNLRDCSVQENNRNRRRNAGNKSGFKGVDLHRGGKYRAQARLDGRKVHLGVRDTAEEASELYVAFAKKHHGAFYRDTNCEVA